MISDPNLIYYACIAKGTIIIAEFNSKDAHLGLIALKCLDKTPSFHTAFSHTVRNRTYLFLIHHPYSYFAIFHENLHNLEGLAFLNSVKDAFENIHPSSSSGNGGGTTRRLETLTSHCFQGEFNPVFRQLLASQDDDMEGLRSPNSTSCRCHKRDESSDYSRGGGGGGGSVADGNPLLLLGDAVNCLKKNKRSLLGDCVKGVGCADGKPKGNNRKAGSEASDEMAIRLSRDFSSSSGSVSTHHKNVRGGGGLYCSGETAVGVGQNKVWRRHVWVVLSMDLIICVILFVVWLSICRGFKCIY